MRPVHRTRLGRKVAVFKRATLHAIDGGFEEESKDAIDVVKTRVFHDDVVMVSLHRHVNKAAAVIHGLIALVLLAVGALVTFAEDGLVGAAVFGGLALPFLVMLALHVIVQLDTVTITGRRSRVSADYMLQKRRARQVHDDAVARVRRRHRQLEDELPTPGEAASEGTAPPT